MQLTNKGHIPTIDLSHIFNDFRKVEDICAASVAIAKKVGAIYLRLPYTPVWFRLDKKHSFLVSQTVADDKIILRFYAEPKINDKQFVLAIVVSGEAINILAQYRENGENIILNESEFQNENWFKKINLNFSFIIDCIFFLNLKNVEIIDEPLAREKKIWNSQYPSKRRIIYKVLVIKLGEKKYRRICVNDFADNNNHRRSPLFHLVSGHTKTKPRSKDMIYVDNYERGLLKLGEIVKDYKVVV